MSWCSLKAGASALGYTFLSQAIYVSLAGSEEKTSADMLLKYNISSDKEAGSNRRPIVFILLLPAIAAQLRLPL